MECATPGTTRPVVGLTIGILILLSPNFAADAASAPESNWTDPLSAMPLPRDIPLARSNVVRVVLQSFQSNAIVKAIVVSPGVIDDFHLINRDAPPLRISGGDLAAILTTLTNATSTQ